ncbi:MAG: secretin N-terminal domain-containing protein [Candidatus Ratteibacteria bacterium]|jgi:general secretion pathway protein D
MKITIRKRTKPRVAIIGSKLFLVFVLLLFVVSAVNPVSFSAETAVENQTISIAFPAVDIKTFIQTMNFYLGKNFVPPPNFGATVTVYSAKPIPIKEAEAVFYSILNRYGLTLVPAGEVVNIIPLADAKGTNIEVSVGSDPEQLVVFGDKIIHQIVPLSYAKAADLAPFLQKFSSKSSGSVDPDAKTNTLIITDVASNVRKLLLMVKQFDQPAPPSQEAMHIVTLQNKDATVMANELTLAMAQQKSRSPRPGESAVEQVNISSSPSSNALIITANPEAYASLEKIIKELDRRPSQVRIEALVAEVSGSLVREFGVQWQFFEGATDTYRGFGSMGGTVGATDLATLTAGLQPTGLIAGVIRGKDFPFNIGALIKLYGSNSNFKILSNPQITAMDNIEAVISVGNNIPYTKQITYATSTTDQGLPTQSFDYKDVGITLKITPHISEDRHVRLIINEEVKKVISASVSVSGTAVLAPTIATRSAQSSVIVNDRETLVLGGLTSDNSDETMEKVPFFGDIPLLGYFFRHKVKSNDQTSLYIFITPTVITADEKSSVITDITEQSKAALKKSGAAK